MYSCLVIYVVDIVTQTTFFIWNLELRKSEVDQLNYCIIYIQNRTVAVQDYMLSTAVLLCHRLLITSRPTSLYLKVMTGC